MSGRFDFHSGGAAATGALEQFIAEQEQKKRQDMLDRITQQNAQSQQQDRLMNRQIQEEQLKGSQEARAQAVTKENFDQSKDIVDMAGANEFVDAPTALKVTNAGFGGRLQKEAVMGTPGIGVLQPEDLPADAQVATEGRDMLKPGKAYEMARQAAAEKTDAATTAATNKTEADRQRAEDAATRAREHEDTMRAIAGGRDNTALLVAGMVQGGKKSALDDKAAAGKEKTDLARKAQVDGANDTLNALAALHDPTDPSKLSPQMGSIVGAWSGKLPSGLTIPGSEIANAKSRLAEVRSRLDVGLLNELKNQSRTGATGFGQLSANELKIIEAASGRLDTAQSPEQFMSALNDIETRVKRILAEPGASHAGDTVSMTPHGETAAPATKPTAAELINKYRR